MIERCEQILCFPEIFKRWLLKYFNYYYDYDYDYYYHYHYCYNFVLCPAIEQNVVIVIIELYYFILIHK